MATLSRVPLGTVPPGTTFTVYGDGFPKQDFAILVWNSSIFSSKIRISKDGNFVTTFTVPSSTIDGTYSLQGRMIKTNQTIATISIVVAKSMPIPATVPGAPVITAIVESESVTLTWPTPATGGSEITSYRVYRNGSFFTSLNVVNTWTDSGMPNGVQYTYQISAVNVIGESVKSNMITALPSTPPTHPIDTIWFDDFNGTALDMTRWRVSNYGVTSGGRRCCGTNHANYADEVSVSDGYLHLGAHLISGLWHTGCIDTETKNLFGYGIWEASIKVPKGTGLWPAFWGYDNSGEEIDVLEACTGPNGTHGGNDVTMVHQGIHRVNNDARVIRDTDMGVDMSLAFHTYSVEYRSGFIQFSIDGVKRGAQITPSLVKTMPLILNLGVGGTWCGDPDGTTPTANEMLVDWVRVRA